MRVSSISIPAIVALVLFTACEQQASEVEQTTSTYKSSREQSPVNPTLRQDYSPGLSADEGGMEQVEQIGTKMGEEIMSSLEKQRQIEAVEELTYELRLTEAQKDVINEHYHKENENREKLTKQLLDKVKRGEKISQDELYTRTLEDVLNEVLTSDQQQILDGLEKRKQQRSQESSAYRELADLCDMFDLSEQQKDAAFNLFYEGEYKKRIREDNDLSFSERELQRKSIQNDKLISSLSAILDEDQVHRFKGKLEHELEVTMKSYESAEQMMELFDFSKKDKELFPLSFQSQKKTRERGLSRVLSLG